MSRALNWNVLLRAALASTGFVALLAPAGVVVAGFLPAAPLIGPLGALLNAGLAWVWIGALAATLLGGVAAALGGRRFTWVLLGLSLLTGAGAGVVTWRFATFASDHGATYDPLLGLGAAPAPVAPAHADAYATYATIDGDALQAGIWRADPAAPNRGPNGRAAVVFVHGGAFVAGGLDMRPGLFDALASDGVPVIDLEYRLAPPPRWDQAPADVLCALAWLRTIAAAEDIDPARVVVMGESAGGSLALIAAYAAGTDRVTPSCPGDAIVPAGVIAVAPAADLAGIWRDATLVSAGLRFPEAYVGGTPSEYPDRYELASPTRLMRANLPPTLLIAAENDRLVRLPRVQLLADALSAAGAEHRLLVVPFTGHGFDGEPNSFGAQVEVSIVRAFVAETTR